MRLKRAFPTAELHRIMTVLNRLVPFLYVCVLQSLAFINTRPQLPNAMEQSMNDELILEDDDDVDADGGKQADEDGAENGDGQADFGKSCLVNATHPCPLCNFLIRPH